MKSLFNLNLDFKHHHTSFFFNSLFTATTFAIIFVFNDYLDRFLEKQNYFDGKRHPFIKMMFHTVTILLITFIFTYIFKFLFGWGNTLLGEND